MLRSMGDNYDVVIIGGSIAGSITGKSIAENGYSVLIIEEHHEIGHPMQCAGLVTPRIFDIIPENDCVLNKVQGAKIYSPSGEELLIDAKKTKALVIDRAKFDQNCVFQALHAGCELELGAKAVGARISAKKISVKILHDGKKYSIEPKLVIGADGVQSQVAHWFGLKRPKVILSGFGAELTSVDLDPRFVEIYLGNNVAPNFFSWAIPKSKAKKNGLVAARVMLACTKSPNSAYYYYKQLFSHPLVGPKLRHARPIQYIAGGIPIGLVSRAYSNRVMLVGDAAGQVKPTSGGGVYTSMICGNHCATTALHALETGDFSAKSLKRYQKAFMDDIGKELKRGLRLHKVYMHLSDAQLEEGFKLLGEKNILGIISKHGDIDYPSKLTTKLFKRIPQLLKFAKPYLRSFF